VPCAPMGTAAIRMATKIASNRKNRSLNAAVTIMMIYAHIMQVKKKRVSIANDCRTFHITLYHVSKSLQCSSHQS
jgi:azurin